MIENKTTEFKREYIDDIKYTVASQHNYIPKTKPQRWKLRILIC